MWTLNFEFRVVGLHDSVPGLGASIDTEAAMPYGRVDV
jgi:hypothetical protein